MKKRKTIFNRPYLFLVLFLIILLYNSLVQAETIPEHTTNLNVYRFTQVLDVSEYGNIDIWLLIQLRFEEDETPNNDYVLKFEIYPTDEKIEILPNNPKYFNYLNNTTTQTGYESYVRFVIDKSVSQEYEYFSFGCKYKPREGSVSKKVSIEGESYDRWRLNHYSGIHQSIGNYVRKFIITPESVIIDDLGDFVTNDDALDKFEQFVELRYSDYEKPMEIIPIPEFEDIQESDVQILFQISLEEVQTTLEYQIFHRPPLEFLIFIFVITCLALCLIAGYVIKKNSKDIKKFTIIIVGAFIFACITALTSFFVYGDIPIMVGILVALLAFILGVYTLGTSKHYADKTEGLIHNFERRQNRRFDGVGQSIKDIQDLVHRTLSETEESIPLQEEKSSKQRELKDEIKKPEYRDETLKLVKMITSEIQQFFPVKSEVLLHAKDKRIDLLIELPDENVIPVEIKRFSKRLVKETLPNKIVQMLKGAMKEYDAKESIVIIMNKGVGKKAEQVFKDVSPETIYLIKGKTVEIIQKRLIKLLIEIKKRYPET